MFSATMDAITRDTPRQATTIVQIRARLEPHGTAPARWSL
ncbi:hypothetical protein I552_8643 [Mycobacterium xenopi 3993]|nr:hypothetical protein I552_8643 [Mycobacterium xenopi 3993]